jgi:hypothetical protein
LRRLGQRYAGACLRKGAAADDSGPDFQFAGSWVAGVFADGQFGALRGTIYRFNWAAAKY